MREKAIKKRACDFEGHSGRDFLARQARENESEQSAILFSIGRRKKRSWIRKIDLHA
jgi:hypothetical protein